MVKIRLFRTGAKKRPTYRIVAIESRRARQGRTLEILGTYDPRRGGMTRFDVDRIDAWIARGAQPSDTVRSLVRQKRRAAAAEAEQAVST